MKKTNFILILCTIPIFNMLMPMKRSFSDFERQQNPEHSHIESEIFICDSECQQNSQNPYFESGNFNVGLN